LHEQRTIGAIGGGGRFAKGEQFEQLPVAHQGRKTSSNRQPQKSPDQDRATPVHKHSESKASVVAGANTKGSKIRRGARGLAGEANDDLGSDSGDGEFWATSYWSNRGGDEFHGDSVVESAKGSDEVTTRAGCHRLKSSQRWVDESWVPERERESV
jgi:hypothetical protein